uniref:Cry23Aa-like protein n=1 Tax=Bacillus thuringiensis TaxID=1428 RepID=A0A1Q1NKM8_BACTU|nr:Cry23Aa-like protein [Bacillus thuringiensis]UWJ25976.1 pesticidal crystal protein Cry23 [Bacillus thuringiensis]
MGIINIQDEINDYMKGMYGATSVKSTYDSSFKVFNESVTPQYDVIPTEPVNNHITTKVIDNPGTSEVTSTVTFTWTETDTVTSAVTKGYKVGGSVSSKATFKFAFVTSDVTVTVSAEYNYSTTETTTKTDTRTWTDTTTVKAPPRTNVEVAYIIQTGNYNVPVNVESDMTGTLFCRGYRDGALIAAAYVSITDLADYNPNLGLTNEGNGVAHFKGEGYIEGAQGLRSYIQVTEYPMDDNGRRPASNTYLIQGSLAPNVTLINDRKEGR